MVASFIQLITHRVLSRVPKCAQLLLAADAHSSHLSSPRTVSSDAYPEMQAHTWLANDQDSPLVELNLIRLYGCEVARQGVGPRLVTWSQDKQTVAYGNKTLHLGRWRAMNQQLLHEATPWDI